MSRVLIRAALEGGLNGLSPPLATSWENAPFAPVAGTPYQAVHLLWARPVNNEFSDNYRQDGIFQITLRYPLNTGPAAATTRAELFAATFKRGATFTASGQNVTITDQAEIMPGYVDGDRFCIPVRSRFHAHIYAA